MRGNFSVEISTPLLELLSQYTIRFLAKYFQGASFMADNRKREAFLKSLGHRKEYEDKYFF